jgi:hypothetical protein
MERANFQVTVPDADMSIYAVNTHIPAGHFIDEQVKLEIQAVQKRDFQGLPAEYIPAAVIAGAPLIRVFCAITAKAKVDEVQHRHMYLSGELRLPVKHDSIKLGIAG